MTVKTDEKRGKPEGIVYDWSIVVAGERTLENEYINSEGVISEKF